MTTNHTPTLTPMRVEWLRFLAGKQSPVLWDRMPKTAKKQAQSASARVWKPMVEAGLIDARHMQLHYSVPSGWYFSITDAGRAALAKVAA